MEVVFLGTSCAIPTPQRNLPAIMLLYKGTQILLDAGEDVQRKFEEASLKFNAPLIIIISHMHGDHIIGLPGLLFHFSLIGRTNSVKIIGPPGIFAYLMTHKYLVGLKANYISEVIEIEKSSKKLYKYDFNGPSEQNPEEIKVLEQERILVHNDKDFQIFASAVEHSIPTWAFLFKEKKRPGKFNPDRAAELKIPKKFWSKIQELEEGATIKINGEYIDPIKEGVIGKKRAGISLCYSADTKPCKSLEKLAENVDILICESTYSSDYEDLAEQKKHMTSKQASILAKKCNVKNLFLTHLSSRFNDEKDFDKLLTEAKNIFPNTYVSSDLMRFRIKKNEKCEIFFI
ncbi:MAG: ribonuclease Z [Promethearchaeota archaeon]